MDPLLLPDQFLHDSPSSARRRAPMISSSSSVHHGQCLQQQCKTNVLAEESHGSNGEGKAATEWQPKLRRATLCRACGLTVLTAAAALGVLLLMDASWAEPEFEVHEAELRLGEHSDPQGTAVLATLHGTTRSTALITSVAVTGAQCSLSFWLPQGPKGVQRHYQLGLVKAGNGLEQILNFRVGSHGHSVRLAVSLQDVNIVALRKLLASSAAGPLTPSLEYHCSAEASASIANFGPVVHTWTLETQGWITQPADLGVERLDLPRMVNITSPPTAGGLNVSSWQELWSWTENATSAWVNISSWQEVLSSSLSIPNSTNSSGLSSQLNALYSWFNVTSGRWADNSTRLKFGVPIPEIILAPPMRQVSVQLPTFRYSLGAEIKGATAGSGTSNESTGASGAAWMIGTEAQAFVFSRTSADAADDDRAEGTNVWDITVSCMSSDVVTGTADTVGMPWFPMPAHRVAAALREPKNRAKLDQWAEGLEDRVPFLNGSLLSIVESSKTTVDAVSAQCTLLDMPYVVNSLFHGSSSSGNGGFTVQRRSKGPPNLLEVLLGPSYAVRRTTYQQMPKEGSNKNDRDEWSSRRFMQWGPSLPSEHAPEETSCFEFEAGIDSIVQTEEAADHVVTEICASERSLATFDNSTGAKQKTSQFHWHSSGNKSYSDVNWDEVLDVHVHPAAAKILVAADVDHTFRLNGTLYENGTQQTHFSVSADLVNTFLRDSNDATAFLSFDSSLHFETDERTVLDVTYQLHNATTHVSAANDNISGDIALAMAFGSTFASDDPEHLDDGLDISAELDLSSSLAIQSWHSERSFIQSTTHFEELITIRENNKSTEIVLQMPNATTYAVAERLYPDVGWRLEGQYDMGFSNEFIMRITEHNLDDIENRDELNIHVQQSASNDIELQWDTGFTFVQDARFQQSSVHDCVTLSGSCTLRMSADLDEDVGTCEIEQHGCEQMWTCNIGGATTAYYGSVSSGGFIQFSNVVANGTVVDTDDEDHELRNVIISSGVTCFGAHQESTDIDVGLEVSFDMELEWLTDGEQVTDSVL
eukprot:COSAG05_NODE_1186_length_5587_cov_26.631560_1_plen_1044_part_10